MKKLLSIFLVLNLIFLNLGTNYSWAQESAETQEEDDLVKKTQEDIIIVGAAGVVGAVLGLSTLSFVETPSRHIYNIWTGAALGIIAGVIYVAYNSAQRNQEDLQSSAEFNSSERIAWHLNKSQEFSPFSASPSTEFGAQLIQINF